MAPIHITVSLELLLGPISLGRGYCVATNGNVTDEVSMMYIEDKKPKVPDDHFKVVLGHGADRSGFKP